MTKKPYLLFDAGGTLLFLDQNYLSRLAHEEGFQIEAQRFYKEHFRRIHWLDTCIRTYRRLPPRLDKPYPQLLFEHLGLPKEAAARAGQVAQARHKAENLWTFTFPWVAETLEQLKSEGYRMSVISNADGRVEQQVRDLGLEGYFDRVYDSAVVGVQKPEPEIYELALKDFALRPEEALFVGDVFCIDIWGANRVGIPGLHLDPLGLYEGWPGARIRDLRQLPGWLERYTEAPERFDVLPLRDFALLE